MKQIVFSLLLLYFGRSLGQRPAATIKTMDSWPTIMNEAISRDGKFILFRVFAHPVIGKGGDSKVEVQSFDGGLKFVFDNARSAGFSPDSRWLVVLGSDSL